MAHKSHRHSDLPLRAGATKAGLTQLAGELSRALALREALIRLDGDVWTVHRGGQPDKADCHSALAAPGPAGNIDVHASCRQPRKWLFHLLIAKPPIFLFACVRVRVFHIRSSTRKRQARSRRWTS